MPPTTVLRGIGVGDGVVSGPVRRFRPAPSVPTDEAVAADEAGRTATIAAMHQALDLVAADLEALAGASGDQDAHDMLAATAEFARDPALRKGAAKRVEAGAGPAKAVDDAVGELALLLQGASGYLAERVTDLMAVRHRVVARLTGAPPPGVDGLSEPSVVVAHDLAPADTAALDPSYVLAVVTATGGPTSHTALLSKRRGVPCVVQCRECLDLPDGATVTVDSGAGTVTLTHR